MNFINKEWTLLLKACQAAIFKKKLLTIEDVKAIDWQLLLQMIRYHKVTPLFYKGLTIHTTLLDALPSFFLENLKNRSFRFVVQNLKNAKELQRIIPLFRKEGIEIIPYKGILLAEMAYQELGLRESSDIDFLIKRQDFEKIKKILLAEGYRPSFNISFLSNNCFFSLYGEYNFDIYKGEVQNRSTRQFHLEPHWVLGNKMYQTYIDYDAVLPLTAKGKLLNSDINRLSPEGLLITTVTHHGSTDQWLNLKTVIDIAVLLQRFNHQLNWSLIVHTCEEFKIINVLLLGLSLSKEFFDSPLPENVEQMLLKKEIIQLTKQRKKKLAHLRKGGHLTTNFVNRIIYQLKLRANWSTKLKVVYYHLIHTLLRPFLYKDQVNG